jgi:DNA polymerase-3 subunit delta'
MLRGRTPPAFLLVGPTGIGKTTLAIDIAAGLLCSAPDPGTRPCGACRACRLVFSDRHADVHRLGPEGPGRQVVIGGGTARVRGVRDLIGELALAPVEGGARVAIIESADRMHEDAQAALLKTLEEPPAGVTLVLCADTEEPILPTIRSRVARLRLGPVSVREIETLLEDLGAAEAPLAARLARIADGRPGLALAWAKDPDALVVRGELVRTMLDLTDAPPVDRLVAVRAAALRAGTLMTLASGTAEPLAAGRPAKRPSAADSAADTGASVQRDGSTGDPADADAGEEAGQTRIPASERRRAAEMLIAIWTDVARDLALVSHGRARDVRDLGTLDELVALAGRLAPDSIALALERLSRAAVLVRGNVSPELVLDDLALRWPRPVGAERAA